MVPHDGGDDVTGPEHPARWSQPILSELERVLFDEAARYPGAKRAVDPFAGVGLSELARVAPQWSWLGLEIEPEWAAQAPGCLVGDATRPPFADESIDLLVTSCTYGNRMADSYDGSGDRCKATNCEDGWTIAHDPGPSAVPMHCSTCDGTGLSPSVRRTYRISLGRPLSSGNSGGMRWKVGKAGKPYRQLHAAAWTAAWRYLKPGALIVVNVSNSLETIGPKDRRVRVEHHVTEWHLAAWLRLGASLEATMPIETRRFSFGQNREQRAEHEWLLILRKPPLPERVNPPTQESPPCTDQT